MEAHIIIWGNVLCCCAVVWTFLKVVDCIKYNQMVNNVASVISQLLLLVDSTMMDRRRFVPTTPIGDDNLYDFMDIPHHDPHVDVDHANDADSDDDDVDELPFLIPQVVAA